MNEGKTRLGKFDKWGYSNMFSKKELARELVYTNEDNDDLKKEIERLNHECDTYLKIATKRGNIIDELEKWLEEQSLYSFPTECGIYRTILNKLKELKEGKK